MRASVIRRFLDTPLEPIARWMWTQVQRVRNPQGWMYDKQIIQIMSCALEKTSNCVDVGSHFGSTLRHMVDLAPLGHHVAFEPLPELAHWLKTRFPNVTIYEVAVSDAKGERKFCHVLDDPGYSGLMRQHYPRPDVKIKEITVATEKLDNLIPEDQKIHFMKIDVEGAELEVLNGAIRTITDSKPLIVFEHGLAAKFYGTTPEMMYKFFESRCLLRISLLSDWLEGKPPLSQDKFISHIGFHYYFLAHP